MKLNLISRYMIAAISSVGLVACGSSDSDNATSSNLQFSFGLENSKQIADDRNIPLPNDLYFLDANGDKQDHVVIMGCGATDVGAETAVENATKCSLEDLDGWSTTAPFSLPITGELSQLDRDTFASAIKLFKGNDELLYDIDFTVQISAFNHLQILPLKVLAPKTTYQLVITDKLTDINGQSVAAPRAYIDEKRELGAFATHINALESAIDSANNGIKLENITYAAQFTTQTIGDDWTGLISNVQAIQFDSSKATKADAAGALFPLCIGESKCVGKLSGTLSLPSYLAPGGFTSANCVADEQNQQNAEFWFELYGADAHSESFKYTQQSCAPLYEPMDFTDPAMTTVEVQMVIPHKPTNSNLDLDVVIAAHGITAVKELGNGGMLIFDNFVQSKMAGKATPADADGYAVIAIDHVYHGSRAISVDSSVGYDCNNDNIADEACFASTDGAIKLAGDYDISVSASVRGLLGGQGEADAKNFLKANALLTSRDNFRKVIADILNLKAALNGSVDSNDKVQFTDSVGIYGHSMGAIAAATASGIEVQRNNPFAGTILANPGGAIGGIIMNSNWLGKDEVPPAVKFLPEFRLRMAKELGLEVAGDEQATLDAVRLFAETNREDFLAKVDSVAPQYLAEFQYLIQAVVDTADPLNYTKHLEKRPVLSITAVGNVSKNPQLIDSEDAKLTAADQTVPIKVELGASTTFERCLAAAGRIESFVTSANCFAGSERVPYYSLNVTDFPLAGAQPLENALRLNDVRNQTSRSYARLIEGNHNIGVGGLTDSVAEGSKDGTLIKAATMEVAEQAIQFMSDSYGVVELPNEALLEPQY